VTNQTRTPNPIRACDPDAHRLNAHRLTAAGRRVVCPGQYLPAALADLDMSHFISINELSTTDIKYKFPVCQIGSLAGYWRLKFWLPSHCNAVFVLPSNPQPHPKFRVAKYT
jgi:hypothetical protein